MLTGDADRTAPVRVWGRRRLTRLPLAQGFIDRAANANTLVVGHHVTRFLVP
jgi:hypothetical protein